MALLVAWRKISSRPLIQNSAFRGIPREADPRHSGIKPLDYEKGKTALDVGAVTRRDGVLTIAMNPRKGVGRNPGCYYRRWQG